MMYRWDKVVPCLSEMYPPSPPTARDLWFLEHGMPTDNERRAQEIKEREANDVS